METMVYQQGFKIGLQFKQVVELVLQLSHEQREMLFFLPLSVSHGRHSALG